MICVHETKHKLSGAYISRHAQTLPYDSNLRVHEKPGLRAIELRAHEDTRDMEEARNTLQPACAR
jgi:hypothetical protein